MRAVLTLGRASDACSQIDGGLELDNHTTSLPMGKGLSSSAAVCVLVSLLGRVCARVCACTMWNNNAVKGTCRWTVDPYYPDQEEQGRKARSGASCRQRARSGTMLVCTPQTRSASWQTHDGVAALVLDRTRTQVARAFNKVFDLKLTTRGEMEFAYLGEIATPSKCGA